MFSYVEQDGNQYVSKWSGDDTSDSDKFDAASTLCWLKSSPVRGWGIEWLSPEKLLPSDYKETINCIAAAGFNLIESNAYFPQGFAVAISKSYTSLGETVRAGGRIIIDTKGTVLADVLPSAKDCYKKIKKKGSYQQGDADAYIYINMEPIVAAYGACPRALGYDVNIA